MSFASYHPGINLLWFTGALVMSLMFSQPIFLLLSLMGAFAYSVKRGGLRVLIFNLCLLPCVVLFSVYYGAFHHFGVTVLWRNTLGNVMTQEAFFCGLVLGLRISTTLMWMSCVFSVFTTDKLVYLLGRVSPRASLFLAILLRMCPRVKARYLKMKTARAGVGMGTGVGNPLHRIKHLIALLSMTLTWLLDSIGMISQSMTSRGGRLPGRRAYSLYSFTLRDRALVVGSCFLMTLCAMAWALGMTKLSFDPRIYMLPVTPLSFLFYGAYGLFCFLPLGLEIRDEVSFAHQRQKAFQL
ncbi:MAG: hypothetical protein IKM59_00675 [Oscillospiraceae bacterium]|nr:hypothetical protein [Oscillospiraceae bacterium]